MCGIAGILGTDIGTAPVAEMTAALRHRGPDRQATLRLPHAHVGAARLRIVDLTAGDQPLVSAQTGAVLLFNGEIYNYPDLRRHLEARGHRFETATDSEVVLRAYEEYGWRSIELLRGMYAFAIVDGNRALLARDPLGIKPLHYCLLNGGRSLAFASEIKSLLRHPDVPARIDEATMGDLRAFEYVADPRATLFEGIVSLEPGRCLDVTLSAAGLDVRQYDCGSLPDRRDPIGDIDAAEEHLDALLDAAVRSHQMADVPICLTLSGGLDSTLLALILREQAGTGIVSYAVSDDPAHMDFPQSQRMAQLLGFEHRAVLFTFEDYLAAMAPSIVAGETYSDDVGQFLLFREIGREFRVAINGEGADELFGGYPEHQWSARYISRLREAPPSLPLTEGGAIERERLLSGPPIDDDRWILDHLMGAELVDRHLQPLDKISMASSVEVRVPYLDYDVAAYGYHLPPRWRVNRALGSLKYIARRVFLRRWRSQNAGSGLLDAVLRDKRGWPDAREASRVRFHALCDRVLPERYFAEHPYRRFLFHQAHAVWFDLFQFLFCRHRGVLPGEFDVLDFIAERADKPRSDVAAAANSVSTVLAPKAAAARESHELGPSAQRVAARLFDIVQATGGHDLQTNGTELWFTLPTEPRIELRLGADPNRPCYDRSANFAISYAGAQSEGPSPVFVHAVDSIKAIDDAPMSDVPVQFALAAAHVVGRRSDRAASAQPPAISAVTEQ
jgi:asparagine synthase (glutamine-hydrolysing)